jgi:anti-sigma-K factor RskA
MSKLNRYQNPEIFERLAMSYASGTLHGRARLRFETLKKRHFYLEATSNAYESKFGSLVELLPNEKPSDSVWKSIEAQIQSETAVSEAPKTSWFGWLSNGYTFALLALLVTTFVIVNPLSTSTDAVAYASVLEDVENTPVAITRITYDDMSVSVDIIKDIPVEDGKVLRLWCHPKNGGKPRMMGKIAESGQTIIKINNREWDHMEEIGTLEISSEASDLSNGKSNQNIVTLRGQLSPISEK